MELYVKHQLAQGQYNVLAELPLRVLLSFNYDNIIIDDKATNDTADTVSSIIIHRLISRATRERVPHMFNWALCTEPIDEYILAAEVPLEYLESVNTTICSADTIARRYIATGAFPEYDQYLRWKFQPSDDYPREFNLHLLNMQLREQNNKLHKCIEELESRVDDLTNMFKYYMGSDEYLAAAAEFYSYAK